MFFLLWFFWCVYTCRCFVSSWPPSIRATSLTMASLLQARFLCNNVDRFQSTDQFDRVTTIPNFPKRLYQKACELLEFFHSRIHRRQTHHHRYARKSPWGRGGGNRPPDSKLAAGSPILEHALLLRHKFFSSTETGRRRFCSWIRLGPYLH